MGYDDDAADVVGEVRYVNGLSNVSTMRKSR
jgi:hypothetical protein